MNKGKGGEEMCGSSSYHIISLESDYIMGIFMIALDS